MRSSALFLALCCACASGAQRREDCERAGREQALVQEKAKSCVVPQLALLHGQCAAACSGADLGLLAAEVECISLLPPCSDPRECKGEACAEAMPGADDRFREQLQACLARRSALSAGCRQSLSVAAPPPIH